MKKSKLEEFIEQEGLGDRNSYTLSKKSLEKFAKFCEDSDNKDNLLEINGALIDLSHFDMIRLSCNLILFYKDGVDTLVLSSVGTHFRDATIEDILILVVQKFPQFSFDLDNNGKITWYEK